jgi:hypothetical protein
MAPATLAKLFEIISGSGAPVSVVLAGLSGDALDQVLRVLPRSLRRILLARPWSRADAELLLTQIAFTLGLPPTDLIAAIDVDAALRTGAGNPRLVRRALAARLRVAALPLAPMQCAAACAPPLPSAQRAAPAALDPAAAGVAPPIASPEIPASARRPRPPSVVRPVRSLGVAAAVRLVVAAGALATMSHGARMDPTRKRIAAAWRTAMQASAAGIARLARASARGTFRARAWARDRLGGGAVRSRARLPLRSLRLAPSSVRSALGMAGVIAALASVLAVGRAPTVATVRASSSEGGEAIVEAVGEAIRATLVEPILVRVNSHPWSTVEIDEVEAVTTPFTVSLAPGPHQFRVLMADGRVLEQVVVVSALHDRVAFR